jgi:hypothetical protein
MKINPHLQCSPLFMNPKLDVNEARRLKHLLRVTKVDEHRICENGLKTASFLVKKLWGGSIEDENRRLKQIVADLTLDNRVLKDVVSKKW